MRQKHMRAIYTQDVGSYGKWNVSLSGQKKSPKCLSVAADENSMWRSTAAVDLAKHSGTAVQLCKETFKMSGVVIEVVDDRSLI